MTQNQKELQLDEDKCTEPRKIENIQLKPVVDSFTKLEVHSTHTHAQKWDVVIYTYKQETALHRIVKWKRGTRRKKTDSI